MKNICFAEWFLTEIFIKNITYISMNIFRKNLWENQQVYFLITLELDYEWIYYYSNYSLLFTIYTSVFGLFKIINNWVYN